MIYSNAVMGVTSHNFVPAETRAILQRHIIDRQRLEIGKEIGRGWFVISLQVGYGGV
jgi:hypothetical protein